MFSALDGDGLLVCWNCEEAVHGDALYCPYCTVDLKKHIAVRKVPPQNIPTPSKVHQSVCKNRNPSVLWFMVPFFCTVIGTSFLFLSLVIVTFSKDGCFTISWQERSWISYLGLGLAFVSFGIYIMQVKDGNEIDS